MSTPLIPDVDDTEKHAAWALYMGGFEANEIVERLPDLNINTLKSWISQLGWYKDREEIAAHRREKNPPEKSPIAQVFNNPDKKAENIKVFQEKMGEVAKKGAEYVAELHPKEMLKQAEKVKAFSDTARKNLDLDAELPGERGHISLIYLTTPGAVRIVQPEPKQIEGKEV